LTVIDKMAMFRVTDQWARFFANHSGVWVDDRHFAQE
jgi:hypothetical protein